MADCEGVDMSKATCLEPGCDRPAASRRGMCGKHYQRVWKQERNCSIDGCDRPYAAKNMCSMHYKRQLKGMSFEITPQGHGKAAGCAVEGCDAPFHANGYCAVHAQRLRRTGDPLAVLRETREDCLIEGCEKPHYGKGYCIGHYKVMIRHGAAEPDVTCRMCGHAFQRPLGKSGSYFYCGDCMEVAGPVAWAALRRERLAANNAGMTQEDRSDATAYRAIIAADPCVYCGATSEAIDHVHPVRFGGSDRWDNLAPICQSCNSTKKDRSVLVTLLARR